MGWGLDDDEALRVFRERVKAPHSLTAADVAEWANSTPTVTDEGDRDREIMSDFLDLDPHWYYQDDHVPSRREHWLVRAVDWIERWLTPPRSER